MPQHRQDRLGAILGQPAAQLGRDTVASVAFLQKSQRGQGVEQNGRRPQVGAESFGRLLGRERLAAQGGPQIELGGRPDHTGGPKTVHHLENLLAIGM